LPLTAAELEALATKPASVSGDAGSTTARSAEDILALNAAAAAVDAVDGTADNGGPKSAWHALRPARASLPGAR
jgi:hypothetical protein